MKKIRLAVLRLFALSMVCASAASANYVTLDTTFNNSGYAMSSPVQAPEVASASTMAIQPDGKKVIGGKIRNVSINEDVGFLVMRFNADGSLDTSFGTNGSTITPIDLSAEASKIIILPDGKILLGGTTFAVATEYDFAVIRYNADGSLDTTFNGTGYVTRSFTHTMRSFDDCRDMVLQPDGKIVLVGRTAEIPWVGQFLDFNFAVMRLNADGSFDTTFNGTGMLSSGTTQDVNEAAGAVIIDANGKIIVGGIHNDSPSHQNFLLKRFNSNGTIDTSFGTNGSVSTRVNDNLSGFIKTLALQSNGKILASGDGGGIARYTPNGVLDTTFGTNGIAFATSPIYSIKVIGGDRILAVGRVSLLRFLENGGRDLKFQYNVSVPNNSCSFNSVQPDTDGKIVLGGNCNGLSGINTNKAAVFRVRETLTNRYLSFGGNERTDFSLYRPSSREWIQSPGSNLIQFGAATDRLVPADFTGDGRADIAVYRPSTGEWIIMRSENGTTFRFQFGLADDIPVAADYDGDQIADIAVFRPSNGTWYIQKSTGGITYDTFGLANDKPVASDYDGDFKTDIAIYRPSSGQWWIKRSGDGGIYAFEFGTSTDRPVQGDYTGDGKTDAAFWRPSTGEWFVLRSENYSYYAFPWGLSDDLPTPGDYSGDSRFDAAVYRPSTNRWYILTAERSIIQLDTGMPGDIPIPNFMVP